MSVIEFEWAGQEWTEADSEAFDREILAYRARKGIEPPEMPQVDGPPICKGECGDEVLPKTADPVPGVKTNFGRGYCRSCYHKEASKGTFTQTPAELRAEQARELYREGLSIREIAGALGCTERSVERYTKDIRDAS